MNTGAELLRGHVQAQHVVAHFGEAGAGDEAGAAGADEVGRLSRTRLDQLAGPILQ